MKRILFLSLLLGFILMPFNVKAGTFDVGVEIKNGKVIVEAETVILTIVEVDVEEQEITPTYVVFMNKGNVNFQVIVENIESGFSNAPTTFVDYNASKVEEKDWEDLNELETLTYIAFGISRDGNEFLSILDDSELNIGTVVRPIINKYGDATGIYESNTKIYQINVKTGFQWDEVENLYYRITYVLEPTYSTDNKPFGGDFVGDIIDSTNITRVVGDFNKNIVGIDFIYSNLNVETDIEAFADIEVIGSNGVKTEYNCELEHNATYDYDYEDGRFSSSFDYFSSEEDFFKEANTRYIVKITYKIYEKGNLIKSNSLIYFETNDEGYFYSTWAFPENMKGNWWEL